MNLPKNLGYIPDFSKILHNKGYKEENDSAFEVNKTKIRT